MPEHTSGDFVLKAVIDAAQNDVEQRVYERIKGDFLKLKFLGGGAAVLLTLVVIFHQTIFRFVVNRGSDEFKQEIAEQIKTERKILADAEAIRNVIQTQIRQYLEEMGRQQSEFAKLSGDFERRKKDLESALTELKTTVRAAQEAKDVVDKRLAAAQSTAQEAANRISASAKELKEMAEIQATIIQELKSRNIVQSTLTQRDLGSPISVAAPRPTVYFQFAGFAREKAKEISAEIEKFKWTIPGEQRTTEAAKPNDTNQVRFNPADQKQAETLQHDANLALEKLGLNVRLALQKNPKVKQGILEIWILQP